MARIHEHLISQHPPIETRPIHGRDMDRNSATQKLDFLETYYLQKFDPVDGYGLHKLKLQADCYDFKHS